MTNQEKQMKLLAQAQFEAQKAGDRMLEMLLGFEPAQSLTIANSKFIAEWARTISFDAIEPFRS